MQTLVVPRRDDDEQDTVVAAWLRRGGAVCRLERFWEPPTLEPASLRLYGDMAFCLFLAEQFGLQLVSPPDDLLLQLHPRWLSRAIQGTTLFEVLQRAYPHFVEPLLPKAFRAAVYQTAANLEQEIVGLDLDAQFLTSEPVTFTSEVRCLVLSGKVVSHAAYEGSDAPNEAVAFAQEFVAAHPVATTFVLDVGWIVGKGWAIIEANATWGAGLNGCSADAMANCLEVATVCPIS